MKSPDICVDLQNDAGFTGLPPVNQLQRWLNAATQFLPATQELNKPFISIRWVNEKESTALNETYRHKKGPTNVLSFPDEAIPGFDSDRLGDLAICVPVVLKEAAAQDKTVEAHLAHLVIHGFLHLLDYDHETKAQAAMMENLEIKILNRLGFKNPFEE